MARGTAKSTELAAEELRQVLGALLRRLRTESAEQGLSQSELGVLKRLEAQGPSTTAALARAEFVKPQSMGATLAALEESRLVTRSIDVDDARCRIVSITDEGRRVFLEGRAARRSWLARAIGEKLDGDEQRALLSAITLLRRVVDS